MRWEALRNDAVVKKWLTAAKLAPYTERNYLISLQMYCDFTNLTPEQMIREADEDDRLGVLNRDRRIKQHMIGFKSSLADSNFSPNTQHGYLSGVKSFYKAYDIQIPNLGKPVDAKPLPEHLDIPSKEDIREALKACDARDKAIILVGCSSGLSASSIVDLTIEQFSQGLDRETGICTLFLRRDKTNTDFITFLDPEATTAVLEYLAYRNRTLDYTDTRREQQLAKQHWVEGLEVKKGRRGKKGGKDEPNGQYLFIKRQIDDSYLQTKSEKLRKLDVKGLLKAYSEIANKSQKSGGQGVWDLIRSHNIRKFFNSTLKNAGMDSDLVEYMMGHTLGPTKDAYFRGNAELLRRRYTEFMVHLTIQKPLDVAASPEYQKIEAENRVLKTETIKHVVERGELAEVKRELDHMKTMQAESNLAALATDMVFKVREKDIHELGKKYSKECSTVASYFPVTFTPGRGFYDDDGKAFIRFYASVPAIRDQIVKWTQEIFDNMLATNGKDFADAVGDRMKEARAATQS